MQQSPHPIVDLVFSFLAGKPTQDGELHVDDIAALQQCLAGIADSDELERAILDLLVLGDFLKNQGSPKYLKAMLRLVENDGHIDRAGLRRAMSTAVDAQKLLGTQDSIPSNAEADGNGMPWWQLRAAART